MRISNQTLVDVFTEWHRQFREDPESFDTHDGADSDDVGAAAARTFLKILAELDEAAE